VELGMSSGILFGFTDYILWRALKFVRLEITSDYLEIIELHKIQDLSSQVHVVISVYLTSIYNTANSKGRGLTSIYNTANCNGICGCL